MFVFVYGTLKRRERNHHLLEKAHYCGPALTLGCYRLYDAGFPVMRMPEHKANSFANAPVRGEVYHVTDEMVVWLDRLEGEGRMYHRKRITVVMASGERLEAFAYIGDSKFWGHKDKSWLYEIEDGGYVWPAKRKSWRDNTTDPIALASDGIL